VKNTSPCDDSPYEAPFAAARSAGILPIIASGNDYYSTGLSSPACAPSAVSVGAVHDSDHGAFDSCDTSTAADKVCCFSNLAPFLDLLAPGSAITAGGVTLSGTSMAAPHVAGAAAVLRAARPGASPADVVAALKAGGKRVADWYTGKAFPRLDLDGAITALAGPGDALHDAAPPAVSGFTINDGAPATTSLVVRLQVAVGDASGVSGMCVTNDAADAPGACAPWVAYTPDAFAWTLAGPASANGYRSVRLFVNDTLGNALATPVTSSVYYDVDDTPPSGSLTVNGGAAGTANASVVLGLAVADDRGPAGAAVCLSNAPSCGGVFRPFAPTVAGWQLDGAGGAGPRTVYAWFRDAAGNVSPQPATATIGYDPAAAAGAVIIEGGSAAPVASTKVSVRLVPPGGGAPAARAEVCLMASAAASLVACSQWSALPKGAVRIDLGPAQVRDRGWPSREVKQRVACVGACWLRPPCAHTARHRPRRACEWCAPRSATPPPSACSRPPRQGPRSSSTRHRPLTRPRCRRPSPPPARWRRSPGTRPTPETARRARGLTGGSSSIRAAARRPPRAASAAACCACRGLRARRRAPRRWLRSPPARAIDSGSAPSTRRNASPGVTASVAAPRKAAQR
jgi:hypothetical protein